MLEGATRLPTIETERTRLRWLVADDVPSLFAIFGDPEVSRYRLRPPFGSRADAEEMLRRVHELFAERTLFQWGIALRESDEVVGTATLLSISSEHARAELGFALRRDLWRRGLVGEAVSALIGFAFRTLGLGRLEADVDPRNQASIRVLERLGFRREGFLRQRYRVGGEWQDAAVYGLLRSEWELDRAAS